MKAKKLLYLILIVIFLTSSLVIAIDRYKPSKVVTHRLEWWLDEIKAENIWKTTTGKNILVGIIDTGIDKTHPDLQNTILGSVNIEKKLTGYIDYTHGTGIAGIIAGKPHNQNGISGIAPDSKIISINICSDKEQAYLTNLIAAINYAINKKVDIINISMGVKESSEKLYDVIKKAYENNIIIVAAAGNNESSKNLLFPARYTEVISVGSTDKQKNIVYTNNISDKTLVNAPGVNIVTTNEAHTGKLYTTMNGTSSSTAIVSGIMALVKQEIPNIKNTQIINYLEKNKNMYLDAEKILVDLKEMR